MLCALTRTSYYVGTWICVCTVAWSFFHLLSTSIRYEQFYPGCINYILDREFVLPPQMSNRTRGRLRPGILMGGRSSNGKNYSEKPYVACLFVVVSFALCFISFSLMPFSGLLNNPVHRQIERSVRTSHKKTFVPLYTACKTMMSLVLQASVLSRTLPFWHDK